MRTPNRVACGGVGVKATRCNILLLLVCSACSAFSPSRVEVARIARHPLQERLNGCVSLLSSKRDTRDTRVTSEQNQRDAAPRLWCACDASRGVGSAAA